MITRWLNVGFLIALVCSNGATCFASSVRPTDAKPFPLVGVSADPFVTAAPLIIGAVCSDGVVLIAIHTAFANEPLLLDPEDDVTINTPNDEEETTNNSDISESSTSSSSNIDADEEEPTDDSIEPTAILKDLPRGYRGPFRIHSIDGYGTSLVCAGWRADGEVLTEYCQSFARDEVSTFGRPSFQNNDYGSHLASQASLCMAEFASSDEARPLSCAALLASCGEAMSPGYLWLVDSTGAYQVRAHALGGGASGTLTSTVNEYLNSSDFSAQNCEEVSKQFVEFLSTLDDIPSESRVELAAVSSKEDTKAKPAMKRLLSGRLFGVLQ